MTHTTSTPMAFTLGSKQPAHIQASAWNRFEWYASTPPDALQVNQDHIDVAIAWRLSLYVRIIAWLHYKDHTTPFFSKRVLLQVKPYFPDLFLCPKDINIHGYDSVLLDHVGYYILRSRSAAFPPKIWNLLESQLAFMRMQVALNQHRDRHIHLIPGVEFPVHNIASMKWTYALFPVSKRLCTLKKGRAFVPRTFWPQAITHYVQNHVFVALQEDTPCFDPRVKRFYNRVTAFCATMRGTGDSPQRMLEHPLVDAAFRHHKALTEHSVFKRAHLKRERSRHKASGNDGDVVMLDAQLKTASVGIVDIEDLFKDCPPCMQQLIEKKHYNFSHRQAVMSLFLSAGADPEDLLCHVKRVNTVRYQGRGNTQSVIKGEMLSIKKTWNFYKHAKTRPPRAGAFTCDRIKRIGLCTSTREACADRCGKSDMEGPMHFVWSLQGRGVFD